MARANQLAQLPRMLDAPWMAYHLVTAKHHQRRKPTLPRLLGVGEAELQRMLAGQERNHTVARNVTSW